MFNLCIDCTFEDIFIAWQEVEKNDRVKIELELQRLREFCNTSLTLSIRHFGDYNFVYNHYVKRAELDLPIISSFFEAVKDISSEAYDFMTDGCDILNIREYLFFENNEPQQIVEKISHLSDFSKFLSYVFNKLLNEKKMTKRCALLRGLAGL